MLLLKIACTAALSPVVPMRRGFFHQIKTIHPLRTATGPMAETYAEAVQGLLSWFKSRSGLQTASVERKRPSFGPTFGSELLARILE